MDVFYKMFLGERSPHDFELVGFLNNYKSFCVALADLLGISIDSTVHLRKTKTEKISPSLIQKAAKLLAGEVALYEEYVHIWSKRYS